MNQRKAIKLARKRSRGIPSSAQIMRWWRNQPDNPDDIESAKQSLAYMSGDQDTTDDNVYAFNDANEGGLTNQLATADAKRDYYKKQMNPMRNTARNRRQATSEYYKAGEEGHKIYNQLDKRYKAHPLYKRGDTFNYGDGVYNSNLGTNAQSTFDHQLFTKTYDLKHGDGAAYNKGADFFFDYDDGEPTRMNVNGADDILNRREKMRGNADIDDMFDGRIDDYGTQEFAGDDDDNGFVDPDETSANAKEWVKKHDKGWAKKNKIK